MASTYEYILSLNDQLSAKLQKITGASSAATTKFNHLQEKSKALKSSMAEFGGSIDTLRKKVDLLQSERDLINPKNLTDIRRYNTAIKGLNKQIHKLETINGSKFKRYTKDAFGSLPPFLTNPVVMASAVVGATGKMALGWEEGMSKINATAQLPQKELDKLSRKIRTVGTDVGMDLSKIPDAYEKIISQTGDVELSTSILESALKGAKAGFTDVDVVSGALAQTLSAVGKENTNAKEVINTLFAAKRVGAGEFRDFANHVPTLVAASRTLGIGYKDAAGLFAFMTGKGQSAEQAATLIQNAFTALGKTDIQDKMAAAGITVFDEQGNIKAIDNIMAQMESRTAGMSDKQKASFFESVGLRDVQAKNAFSILSADVTKLKSTLASVREPAGEMQAALDNTINPANKLREAWSKIQGIMLDVGGAVMTVLNPALDIAIPIIQALGWGINILGTGFGWWIGMVQDGAPIITALTVGLGMLTVGLQAASIATKMQAIWTGTLAIATKGLAVVNGVLNAVLNANPVFLIITGIAMLTTAVILAWKKFEGFRKVVLGMWEVMKGFGMMLKDYVLDRIKGIISGVGGLGKALMQVFQGDFGKAWETAKQAGQDLIGVNAIKNAAANGKKLGEAWEKGKQKGADSFAKSKTKQGNKEGVGTLGTVPNLDSSGLNNSAALNPQNAPAGVVGSASSSGSGKSIKIEIGKVGVDNITLHVANLQEGLEDIKDQVLDTLLSVVNSVACN